MDLASYSCEMDNPAMKKSSLTEETQAKSRELHFQSKIETWISENMIDNYTERIWPHKHQMRRKFEKFLVINL